MSSSEFVHLEVSESVLLTSCCRNTRLRCRSIPRWFSRRWILMSSRTTTSLSSLTTMSVCRHSQTGCRMYAMRLIPSIAGSGRDSIWSLTRSFTWKTRSNTDIASAFRRMLVSSEPRVIWGQYLTRRVGCETALKRQAMDRARYPKERRLLYDVDTEGTFH